MRSHKLFMLLGAVIAILSMAVIIGCSSNDDPVTGNPGTTPDPNFVVVQANVDKFIDSTVSFLFAGLEGPSRIPADDSAIIRSQLGPEPPPGIGASYSYGNGWHVVQIAGVVNGSDFLYNDSMKFLDTAGLAMETIIDPASLVYKHIWGLTAIDTTVTHENYLGHMDIDFAGLNTDQAIINGNASVEIYSKNITVDSVVVRDFSIQVAIGNIQVDKALSVWTHGCPTNGTISAVLTSIYQKDANAPDTTTWSITASFTDGQVNTNVVSGSQSWNYDRTVCAVTSN